MTYEKEIPDYALVPAKEPEERVFIPITQGAIYSPVQVTNITELPKAVITVEEDILVPDTRPDLQEILMIDGKVRLANREVEPLAKNEEYINLSGDIELQVLYLPEKADLCGSIISIGSRVPFKDQWHIALQPGTSLCLTGRIEKIEHMVINERKFRVKLTVAVEAKAYADSKVDIFEGLADEEIQARKEKVEMTNVALRKKDTIAICEALERKESDESLQNILRQDICVVENYKQVTGEKAVINGFIYVNLLYTTEVGGEAQGGMRIEHRQDRVEFTQFIPLSQSGEISGSGISLDGSDLKVKLTQNEAGEEVFQLEGEITTYLELYCNIEKEIIIDAYHQERDFLCDFEEIEGKTMVGSVMGEASLREILSIESEYGEVERILYTAGEILHGESRTEGGKIVTEGVLLGKLICQSSGEDGRIFALCQEIPFRCVIATTQMNGGETIFQKIYLKDLWAEKINSKQLELSGSVLVTADIMHSAAFKVLKNPAFEEVEGGRRLCPMLVYIVKSGDDLWGIAKKFKTTVDGIRQMNQIEEEPEVGQKLLILK